MRARHARERRSRRRQCEQSTTTPLEFIRGEGIHPRNMVSRSLHPLTQQPKTKKLFVLIILALLLAGELGFYFSNQYAENDLLCPPAPDPGEPEGIVKARKEQDKSNLGSLPSFPDWAYGIDIVVPWSGLTSFPSTRDKDDVSRDRYNGEIEYLLRSVAQNAPWVRKIWLLANGEDVPSDNKLDFIPRKIRDRTAVIDRCTYMPNGTCPTRNSLAVCAYAHRLPSLSERFIFVEDDIFLGKPVTAWHFFDEGGRPYVWRKAPSWGHFQEQEFHRLYISENVVDFPTPNSTAPSPHFWFPQLKSVCTMMEDQYKEFYNFLGSHTGGRYSSLAGGVSDEDNSQEEDPYGFLSWELLRTGRGVYKNIDAFQHTWWDEVEISERGFIKIAACDRPIFMNVNDRFSKNDLETYQRQIDWFRSSMDKAFPNPDKQLIVGIGIPKAGSNKLDTMIPQAFGLESCNDQWSKLPMNTARAAIYCSHGKTIADPFVKTDVFRRFGTECGYLGTHQDLSISLAMSETPENVSYVTMLRNPIERLVSACNYDLGEKCNLDSFVELAKSNRGYGMPNRMTKMIGGVDPVCSLEGKETVKKYEVDDLALLERAKQKLQDDFLFVGILERLPESIKVLQQISKSYVHLNNDTMLPRLPTRGGTFHGEHTMLLKHVKQYIELDLELYRYANELLDKALES